MISRVVGMKGLTQEWRCSDGKGLHRAKLSNGAPSKIVVPLPEAPGGLHARS